VANHHVAVCDDSATARIVLASLLAQWRVEVTLISAACDAPAAVAQAAASGRPVSVLLLDLHSPRLADSIAAARAIRELPNPLAASCPIVALAGAPFDPAETDAAGIGRTLLKPIKHNELLTALLGALGAFRVTAGVSDQREHSDHRILSPTASGRLGSPPSPLAALPPLTSLPPVSCNAPTGPLVLVAEDNAVNQKVTVAMLARANYRAEVVVDGTAAVARALTEPRPAVVLMDISMPELSGLEAVKLLREREVELHLPRLRVVALTAHAMAGDRERAIDAGMDDYVAKPVSLDLLIAAVARNIAAAEADAEVSAGSERTDAAASVASVSDAISASVSPPAWEPFSAGGFESPPMSISTSPSPTNQVKPVIAPPAVLPAASLMSEHSSDSTDIESRAGSDEDEDVQTRAPFRPAAALAMLGGDLTVLIDVAAYFIDANPHELLALEAAVLRRDSVAAEAAAVAIQSSLAPLCAPPSVACASQVSKRLRGLDWDALPRAVAALRTELGRLSAVLSTSLDSGLRSLAERSDGGSNHSEMQRRRSTLQSGPVSPLQSLPMPLDDAIAAARMASAAGRSAPAAESLSRTGQAAALLQLGSGGQVGLPLTEASFVVGGSEDMADVSEDALRACGHEVVRAREALEALTRLSRVRCDVLVLVSDSLRDMSVVEFAEAAVEASSLQYGMQPLVLLVGTAGTRLDAVRQATARFGTRVFALSMSELMDMDVMRSRFSELRVGSSS
jgi:CheY-like chemotaxis protein